MANLKEQEKWEDGVYQIEENDPVLGGENGITNKPAKQLANRTLWLKKFLELLGKKSAPKDLTADSTSTADESGHSHKLPVGSTTQKGIWQATSDTGLDSEGLVFTAKGAKKLAQIIANVQIAVSQKWTAKSATETEPGILPVSHKTDGTAKDKFASEFAVGEAAKKGLPVGSIVAFPTAVTKPNGFLRANGSTFNASAFPDLYKVLGNSNTLPDLTRSDVGMTAYFATDAIPAGWIAFDDIAAQVTQQRYPELYRHLVAKYGSISAVPKAADRFIRNAGAGLQVGQTQEDTIKTHKIQVPDSSYPGNNMGIFHYGERGNLNDQNYNELTYNGGDETRPKSLVLKLCIKAVNSFDDVQFWIKSHGEVVNIGALDAGRLSQGLQDKADRNHTHTVSDIVDFNSSVTELIKNVVRKTYQQTKQHKKKIKIRVKKGPSYVYEDREETINIQTEGTMTVYPNGKIEQIIAFRNFSPTWFGAETNDNALHIPVQLWSSMPNKVDYVTVFLNKTKSGTQYASEATEWILGWAEDIQEQIKDKVTIRAVRWTGGQDEPVDLIIKVEGY